MHHLALEVGCRLLRANRAILVERLASCVRRALVGLGLAQEVEEDALDFFLTREHAAPVQRFDAKSVVATGLLIEREILGLEGGGGLVIRYPEPTCTGIAPDAIEHADVREWRIMLDRHLERHLSDDYFPLVVRVVVVDVVGEHRYA